MTGEAQMNGDVMVNGGVQANGEVEVNEVLSVSGKIQKYGLDKSVNQDPRENGVDDCNCFTCCNAVEVKLNGLVVNGNAKKDESDGSYVFVNSGDADVDIVGDSEGDSVKVDLVEEFENKGAGEMVELIEAAGAIVNCENDMCSVDKLVVEKREYMIWECEVLNGENGDPVVEGSKVGDGNKGVPAVDGESVADKVEIETKGEIALECEVLNKDKRSIVKSNVPAENGEVHVENGLSEEVVLERNVVTGDGNVPPENSGVGGSVSNFENDKGKNKDAAPESNVIEERKDCDVNEKEDKREIEAGNDGTDHGENGYSHNDKDVSSDAVIGAASEIRSVAVEMVESKTAIGEHHNVEEQPKEESSEAAGENLEFNSEGSETTELDSKSEVLLATLSESVVHKEADQDLKSTIIGSAESEACITDSKNHSEVVENENSEVGVDVTVKETTVAEPHAMDNKNDNGVVENENGELGADVTVKESAKSEPCVSDGPSSNEKKDDFPSQPSLDTVCEIKTVTESIGTNWIADVQVDSCGTGDSVNGGQGAAENGVYCPIKKINSSSWADACSSDDENAEPATETERVSGEEEQKIVVAPCVTAEPASTEEDSSATAETRLSPSLINVRSVTEICFGSLSPEEIYSTSNEDNCVGSGAPVAVSNSASSRPLSVDMPHTNEELQMKVQDVDICDNDGGQVGDQAVAPMDKRDEQAIDRASAERPIDQEAKAADVVPRDETVLAEGPNVEASEGKTASSGTQRKRLFNFLVRVPRQDDGDLKEQINNAHTLVAQKTEIRDAIRTEVRNQRAAYKEARDNLEAARSEERAAWDLVNKKRNEMDSLQVLINKARDSVSIDDISEKINNLNRRIQIGGISLKEEKQILNGIKQWEKRKREHCISIVSLKDEPKQDADQKEQHEERMKCLRKEIEPLKENARKTKAAFTAARQKHSDENEKLRQLQARFQDADEVRQSAYARLQSLKNQLYEKNKNFWKYKNELKESNELASKGDLQGLSQLCLEQVEDFMKSWNENDRFREEYIKNNALNTLRRLRTSDGRSLGPDEEPPAIPVFVSQKGAKETAMPAHPSGDRDIEAVAVEVAPAADKSPAKSDEQKKQTAKTEILAKSVPQVEVTVSGRDEIDEVVEEPKQSKEEEELIRKAEQLRKEEEEARLREQRRLEEKNKAKEALERKKRNAEKAQARAALRAQKEAEQKEKEREKKAKKKEKKKLSGAASTDTNKEGKSAPPVETPVETPVELETREGPVTNSKKPKRPSHFVKVNKVKSIPPPLRNRGKRKLQPWMWVLLIALLFLALFVIGNGWFIF